MKKLAISLVLILLALSSALLVAAQDVDLSSTFTSSNGLFSIQYPAEWTADEVGPSIFWLRTPNTDWIPNAALPPGGARISIFLPAQANFVPLNCPLANSEVITINGREWQMNGGQFSGAPGAQATAYCTEFPDGWMSINLHAAAVDQAAGNALVRAMLATLTYEPVTDPTPTATATVTPTARASATPSATATRAKPLPADQTFSAQNTGFSIQYPQGWVVTPGDLPAHYIIANSAAALESKGENLREADIVIQVVAAYTRSDDDSASALTAYLETSITGASLTISSYAGLDYPAFLMRASGNTETGRIPRNLRIILADIDGKPTLFIMNSYRPFADWEAQVVAILNTATYQ